MARQVIEGVVVKELRLIPDERGYLMEMLRKDDPHFSEFGQCYISAVYPGVVKGWHFHREQTDNVVCVHGMIKLVIYDNREGSPTAGVVNEFCIGDQRRVLIQIPKGVYHGWKGIGSETALVFNCPDKVYDYQAPDEHRLDPHENDIPYDWASKDG